MLKASSLSNAIFVCLMISVFSGCLVLISHYQNLLNSKLDFEETLINVNNATFKYYLNNSNQIEFNTSTALDIFENDITTFTTKKKWGFYDILLSQTIFKNDTINRIGLIGILEPNQKRPSLFVTDYDKPLKLSGKSKVIGFSKVPNGIIEQAYLNGQEGNSVEIKGTQSSSEDKLPTIKTSLNLDINAYKMLSLEHFKSNTIINSFSSETIVLNVSNSSQLSDVIIKGNIVIFSTGSIKLTKSAQLHDVVLMANDVLIESGFSGNLQIVAKKNVIVEENTNLKYPSSVYVKNDLDSIKVHIKSSSKIAGGIVIDGNTYKGSLKRQLIIDEDSKVYGNVYCYGKTQLQGDVIGQLYTDRFFLKNQSSDYENVILNGSINGDSLPENFVQLPIFNSENNTTTYEIIKEF
nr:hypothetical protein [uncultured Psychroserpens sp.]